MLWTTFALLVAPATAQTALEWTSPPVFNQCENTTVRWTGGQAPYTLRTSQLATLQSQDVLTPTRRILTHTPDQEYEWTVKYARGTSLYIEVLDAAQSVLGFNSSVGDGPLSCQFWTVPEPYPYIAPGAAPSAYSSGYVPQTGDPIIRPPTHEHKGTDVGPIVGGTLAGIVVLAVIASLAVWIHRLRKRAAALEQRVKALEGEPMKAKLDYAESVASSLETMEKA